MGEGKRGRGRKGENRENIQLNKINKKTKLQVRTESSHGITYCAYTGMSNMNTKIQRHPGSNSDIHYKPESVTVTVFT